MKKLLLAVIIVVFTGAFFFFVKGNVADTAKAWPARVLNVYPGVISKLVFSPDGKVLAFVGQNNDSFIQIKLLNTTNWKQMKYPKASDLAKSESNAEGSFSKEVSFSPDNQQVAISHSADILAYLKSKDSYKGKPVEKIDIRKMGTWEKVHQITINGPNEEDIFTQQLSYSHDGKYFVQIDTHHLRIWETKDWKLLHTLHFKNPTNVFDYLDAFSISPDSKTIATVTSRYVVKLWNIETGLPLDKKKQFMIIPLMSKPLLSKEAYRYAKIQFSPDGTKLAIITGDTISSKMYLWDLEQEKILYTIKDSVGGMHGLSFSPDGKYIATSSFAPQVVLWDAVSGEKLKILDNTGNFPYNDVQYAPDGKILAACVEGQIKIWEMSQVLSGSG